MKYLMTRTFAYLTDCLIAFTAIMLIFQWGILSHIWPLIGITDSWFESSVNMQLYVLVTISIPVWIYFAYFDSEKSKGTIGKRLFKLSVEDVDGQRITFGRSMGRTLLKLLPWEMAHVGVIFPAPLYFMDEPEVRMLSYIAIFLFITYVLSILVDKRNQSLYDKWLGTFVHSK
ncbi:MAG: RDD family protein [Saprospiraceae bacterium]|nr:RDD family protein [Saprospiraceae bacterium]